MTLLLIDADILIYQAIASAEQEFEFVDGNYAYHTNIADAKNNFMGSLQAIFMRAGTDSYKLCVSDSLNWRKGVYPEYKSNRKHTRKPLAFNVFRQWVLDSYDAISKPTLEADDVLGILATKPGNDVIIWSIDKDLKQIPCKHITKDGIVAVTKEEGDYFHLRQTLTGDATDGYPGCPGVGPVKAEKLLDPGPLGFTSPASVGLWPIVAAAYVKAGLTEADALVQARIARICQWENWDQNKQEVIMWSPQ